MDERMYDLRSKKNPSARVKIMRGHFATVNAHIDTYIDMSTVKVRHNNCKKAAGILAAEYIHSTPIETIVCLEETSTIGAFMAEKLGEDAGFSLSGGNNISVVIPEYHQSGQILFRDNVQRMIQNQQVLILAPTISTGSSVLRAIEAVEYYGGMVCGVCAVFSTVDELAGIPVKTIFAKDEVSYNAYSSIDCPLCKAGHKLEAIVNSYGYSKL